MYGSASLNGWSAMLGSPFLPPTNRSILPSESHVMSCSVPCRLGSSSSRWIGMIGKSWSIAQLSGSDWKSEKLQKYRSTSAASRSAMMSSNSSRCFCATRAIWLIEQR